MLFGVELEFFLLEPNGFPALGTAIDLVTIASKRGLTAVPELGSFQIELNPGPWPLTKAGRNAGLAQLRAEVATLGHLAKERGLELSQAGFVSAISREMLEDVAFFTGLDRYLASSRYFRNNFACLALEDGSTLEFPGETAVACINELHVHVQLQDDASTIRLFNKLNESGIALARTFLGTPRIDGKLFAQGQSTMTLFEQANSEYDASGTVKRVGFLDRPIDSYQDYSAIVEGFAPIPTERGYLSQESTVYFWVRLRGKPGTLRIEYRPPEMSEVWETTILDFLAEVDEMRRLP
jgi:hypothetical protein